MWLEKMDIITPSECCVVRLQAQQTASCEMAVLVIVDDCSPLQHELVNIWLYWQYIPRKKNRGVGCLFNCVCARVGASVCVIPGNELSAMVESSMRFFSPLKLRLFHYLLSRQVTLWIRQISHHESKDGQNREKRLEITKTYWLSFEAMRRLYKQKRFMHVIVAHSWTTHKFQLSLQL